MSNLPHPRSYNYIQKRNSHKWWKRRSFQLLGVIIVICIVLGIVYGVINSKKSAKGSSSDDKLVPESQSPNRSTFKGFLASPVTPTSQKMYFGTHVWGDELTWAPESPTSWNKRTGHQGAGFGAFVHMDPITGIKDPHSLLNYAEQVRDASGFFLITLEPTKFDLDDIDDSLIEKIVNVFKIINDSLHVPILLRFAHEMNGSWYDWGQQPSKFRKAWIRLTNAIRQQAPLTSMVWSPNAASGYPWAEGEGKSVFPKPGSADFIEMDTNRDGAVDENDDPFTPYWPGDKYVDWVGLSVFWYGPFPFGKNTMPTTGAVADSLLASQHSIISFAKAHGNKPFGIFEGAAVYYPSPRDPTQPNSFASTDPKSLEFQVQAKTSWLAQLLDPSLLNAGVSLVMWFDMAKLEGGIMRDFTITWNDTITTSVRDTLNKFPILWASEK